MTLPQRSAAGSKPSLRWLRCCSSVYELLEESLGDDLLRRPECIKEGAVKILQVRRFIKDRLDSLPGFRLSDCNARRGHGAQRHPDGGFGDVLQMAQDGLLRAIGDLGSADGWRALANIIAVIRSASGMEGSGGCECQRSGR